jgi:hypothetical protein
MPRAKERRSKWRVQRGRGATPLSMSIDGRYRLQRLDVLWDKARYDRLCKFLNSTRYEIASLVGVGHRDLDRKLETGEFFHGSTCILLSVMEKTTMQEYAYDIPEEEIIPMSLLANSMEGKENADNV